MPGSQPLIYTGQEIGLSRRLEFFEKDPITDWSANTYTTFWKKLVDLKHGNKALAAGEKGGDIVWWEIPDGLDGIVAFHREVKGNKVIVLANFGVAPVVEAVVPSEAKESTDNRPAGETGGTPFVNLKSAPVTLPVNLDGKYTEVFSGKTYKRGMNDFTLAPGEYVVLTK